MESYNRRTPLFLATVFGLSLGIAGCSEQGSTEAAGEPQGKVVATLNGKSITESELNKYRDARADSSQPQDEEALLNELVTQELVYEDALQRGLDKDPKVLQELEQLRTRILVSAMVRKAMEDNPATDEQLRAEYDQLKDSLVISEYKASHILVEEKEQAEQLIAQLDDGADFAELAGEHSTGPTGKNGGDLGWINPQQMVPPFSQALQQMETGSYSKEPVNTRFGWHVIKLDESRQSEPPAFEDLKGQLAQMTQQRRVSEYIAALREKADISINGEAGEEKTAPLTAE
ncbi:peptidylprolyl isomerase [Thiohalomonas denitrificans]|uniref:peptidylprolyl isomerase n=1 Tax=Thiohalomonas denitrificans TaxID=415747 RepID=A0A1G5QRC3_9GAMM|nr:peptidylprolyl isomerase [Thiohalomonas denitrificans]SCZ64080.1 peptidyl-prolyl cis-trans isomerase C [Thiohalomonas denitrificans]